MVAVLLWTATVFTSALLAFYAVLLFRYTHDLVNQTNGYAHRAQVPPFATKPLTVIICAKNEASNLQAYLPKVLQQDYYFKNGAPAFEVIVVNDGSDDGTNSVLDALQQQHLHLRTINIAPDAPRSYPGKKFPLSQALAAAQHDWIVCTDADCAPASLAWLHFMAAPLHEGKEIVAGYGGMILRSGWLNAFIRYETKHTFLQYFSFARFGFPYMAVGRNLAATKEKFLQAQSAPAWKALPSGDDDLLVQLCANRQNMAVVAHPASFTWSRPKETWPEYVAQKRRHVSTAKFYSFRTKMLVGLYACAHLFWWILFVFFLLHVPQSAAPLLCLAIPMIMLLVSLQQGASALCERSKMLNWFLFSLCWVLYNAVLAPYILWKTKQRWK